MTSLVFISLENWDEIWRRNQFVCAELARQHPEWKILFITPPRDISNSVRRLQFGRFASTETWSPKGLPNVLVSTPTKYFPNSFRMGRSANARGLCRHVRAEMSRFKFAKPLLWINDHSAATLAGALGETGIVYDITDDWISFDQSESLRERTRAQDAKLCRLADAVIVCSQRLQELKRPMVEAERLHLISNGVDADHYENVCDRHTPPPPAARLWPKPVLGYTGTIHAGRVDIDLLVSTALALRQGSVVLIGPNHLSAEDQARLHATGRVILAGQVPHEQIPDFMRAFDVCIVPHRVTPFTESLNPIKLWEYLASGKPIVSTPVSGFRDFPQFVEIARSAGEFCTACVQRVTTPHDPVPQQRAVRPHLWHNRVADIERVLSHIDNTAKKQPCLA